MNKTLNKLLSSIDYKITGSDGKVVTEQEIRSQTELDSIIIDSLVFDSRDVKQNSLFFALPGTHTTGNKFIAQAISNGAVAIVFQDEIIDQEVKSIKEAINNNSSKPIFIKVASSRQAMSPIASTFYDNPSQKLSVIGVTGTEGKSSTVAFIWQLLKLCGYKAGFISTVQYSLGGDAVDNPQHQTTPEAPIVQKELYEMVQNGCTYAVVESSSHGLSKKLNRLGDVHFDCGVFMNVTLEHLEFHGTYEQYKSDKANLFRALDIFDHKKIINNKETTVNSFGIVNLEDPAAEYFSSCTTKQVYGFTTEGKAGKNNSESLAKLPITTKDFSFLQANNIVSTKTELSFDISTKGNELKKINNFVVHSKLPGAFNTYNIMACLLAVSGMTDKPIDELNKLVNELTPIKGRMTVIEQGQPFEVIVDYAHTPSSFETIFPPIKKRCTGKMICLFGSGGERDTEKRPLQGAIAAKYCDTVILTDEDPRGEDSIALLEQIAIGARQNGKIDNQNLFLIPDRPKAIRFAFLNAKENDIILLLGKSHENSIIYKDHVMKYDEIAEAKKALAEKGYTK